MQINDGLTNLVTRMGTDADKSASTTYTMPVVDRTQEYVAAYRTSWLARRIVDQVSEDAFRKWRSWQADAGQISALEASEGRLKVRSKLERAYSLARLYGKAYVYISIKGDEDRTGEPLIPDRVKRGGVSFLQVFTKSDIAEGDIDQDAMSENYGRPSYYEVSGATSMVRIHPSRLIEFRGNELPQDYILGTGSVSVLESALPAVKRFDSISHNVAGMTHDARVRVLYIQNLAANLEDNESAVLARAAAFQMGVGNFGLGLLDAGDSNRAEDKGERLDQTSTSFATLPDIIQKAQEEASAAARIPRAMLFGTSAGGLGSNGELELSSYYDYVNTIQSNEIQPAIELLDECLIRDALGSRPSEIHYNWNSLWQQSDKERAEIGDKMAATVQKLIASGAIPAEVMTKSAVNGFTEAGIFPGLEQDFNEWIESGGMIGQEADLSNDVSGDNIVA